MHFVWIASSVNFTHLLKHISWFVCVFIYTLEHNQCGKNNELMFYWMILAWLVLHFLHSAVTVHEEVHFSYIPHKTVINIYVFMLCWQSVNIILFLTDCTRMFLWILNIRLWRLQAAVKCCEYLTRHWWSEPQEATSKFHIISKELPVPPYSGCFRGWNISPTNVFDLGSCDGDGNRPPKRT